MFKRPNQRVAHGALQAIYKPAKSRNSATGSEIRPSSDNDKEDSKYLLPSGTDETPSGPRLGLIVAKRFLPHAVDRNRLKRLIREAFRLHYRELPAVDIIVRLQNRPGDAVNSSDVAALFGKMQRSQ